MRKGALAPCPPCQRRGLRPLLPGAGGVGLQRADAVGEGAAAGGIAGIGGRGAVGDAIGRSARLVWRGSAASMASIGEFGPSSCIASLATSAAMSLMRSRSSAFSMRSVAQELSACCWIALMSRCSLARSSRAMRELFLDRGLLGAQLFDRRRFAAAQRGDFGAQFLRRCARRPRRPGAAGCSRSRARPAACLAWRAGSPGR